MATFHNLSTVGKNLIKAVETKADDLFAKMAQIPQVSQEVTEARNALELAVDDLVSAAREA